MVLVNAVDLLLQRRLPPLAQAGVALELIDKCRAVKAGEMNALHLPHPQVRMQGQLERKWHRAEVPDPRLHPQRPADTDGVVESKLVRPQGPRLLSGGE